MVRSVFRSALVVVAIEHICLLKLRFHIADVVFREHSVYIVAISRYLVGLVIEELMQIAEGVIGILIRRSGASVTIYLAYSPGLVVEDLSLFPSPKGGEISYDFKIILLFFLHQS